TRCATTRSTPTASAMPSRPPRLLPSWKGPTSMTTARFGLRRTRRRVPLCSADRDPASIVQTWSGGSPWRDGRGAYDTRSAPRPARPGTREASESGPLDGLCGQPAGRGPGECGCGPGPLPAGRCQHLAHLPDHRGRGRHGLGEEPGLPCVRPVVGVRFGYDLLWVVLAFFVGFATLF